MPRTLALVLRCLPVGLVLVQAAPALADERHYSRAFDQCMSAGDTLDVITGCLQEEWARRDTLLNQAYGSAMAPLSPERRNQLRQDERHWLAANATLCDHDPMVDGSDGQIAKHRCYLDRTIQRTAFLRNYR